MSTSLDSDASSSRWTADLRTASIPAGDSAVGPGAAAGAPASRTMSGPPGADMPAAGSAVTSDWLSQASPSVRRLCCGLWCRQARRLSTSPRIESTVRRVALHLRQPGACPHRRDRRDRSRSDLRRRRGPHRTGGHGPIPSLDRRRSEVARPQACDGRNPRRLRRTRHGHRPYPRPQRGSFHRSHA